MQNRAAHTSDTLGRKSCSQHVHSTDMELNRTDRSSLTPNRTSEPPVPGTPPSEDWRKHRDELFPQLSISGGPRELSCVVGGILALWIIMIAASPFNTCCRSAALYLGAHEISMLPELLPRPIQSTEE